MRTRLDDVRYQDMIQGFTNRYRWEAGSLSDLHQIYDRKYGVNLCD